MFERLRERFDAWSTYRETVRELSRLDRYTLSDIGIPRRDIRRHAGAATRLMGRER